MKKRVGLALSLLLAASTVLGACGAEEGSKESGKTSDFKVGMVTDEGGIDDKSFNQSAWEGITKFGKENNLDEGKGFKYLQSTAQAEYEPNVTKFAEAGYNLTYGIGFKLEDTIQKAAGQYPDSHFALVDSLLLDEKFQPVSMDNVVTLTFQEEQGSFLAGAVAAKHSKSNKIGFVGGINSPLIKKFENGFKAGAKAVNPNVEVLAQYAESFSAPDKGATIASTMYDKGADIIYIAAGGTGNGVFTEAKNRKKKGQDVWVIGVDRDQHEEGMPENVTLTSMVKRVDIATYETTKQAMEGKFPGGKDVVFGLKEDGIKLAKGNLSDEEMKLADEWKAKILSGEVKVPKTDEEFKSFSVK
ncbi:BMP family protein [Bacillus sp. 03113]|uniref:BMP family lipoprotein n=1 Tax=Bacillus sp. 03113 TaxID=2578211 RepID=UPI0011412BE6|nr:BMP family protein [Bacillus sp. 03113]